MKRIATFVLAVFLLVSGVLPLASLKASAADANLIANPSAETPSASNSAMPDGWQQGNWGTNTTNFTYDTTGHTGSRSLKAQVTAYTDGDAKWYFNPVAVSAGSNYSFTDYYESTVATSLVAQFDNGAGSYTYADLGTVNPSATWAQATATFTAPATAKNVTIFHIINAVGGLSIDDSSLAQVVTTPTPTPTPTPQSGNIVPNASLEIASGNQPQNWQTGGWGTNTTSFSYVTNDGEDGTHSVKVQTTNYTNGDAKWYFTPQAVAAGAQYDFSDYYKSTIATDVVVQFDNGAGSYSYTDLGTAVASTAWKQFKASFTVPTGMKNATIFHLISGVGTLQTDNYALAQTAVTPPTDTGNLVPNPSVETATAGQPQNWQSSKWGTNTTTFSYLSSGAHTGSHAVKVQTTKYTSGDAKWYFTPVTVDANKLYDFSDYYKSTTKSFVVVDFGMNDGTDQYVTLGTLDAASSWTKFEQQFSVPQGAKTVTVFHMISSVGAVTTDDFSLQTYAPVGFNRPLVSLTFDDAWESVYTNGLPILQKYGLTSTQYLLTGMTSDPEYMTPAQMLAFKNAGHEIASHTVTHPDLTTLSATKVKQELANSQKSLQQWTGAGVTDFASPYGSMDATVLKQVKTYYASHRGVVSGFNGKNYFNTYDIKVQDVESNTSLTQIQAWVNQAKATSTWLVLVYHQIDANPNAGDFNTPPADFDAQMNAIKNSGVTVETVAQALAELKSQL